MWSGGGHGLPDTCRSILFAQTFPKFGPERRGALVIAYVRLDHEPIPIRCKVYAPDVVIVAQQPNRLR